MEALAVHVMVDLHGCPPELLDDLESLRASLEEASRIAQTHVLGDTFHKFEPQGVSGLLLVSESHLSIHTWPEHRYAAVDIFSCGDKAAVERATDFIVRALRAQSHTIGRTDRGMLDRHPSMKPVALSGAAGA